MAHSAGRCWGAGTGGSDALKLAELRLPLQHGAHGRACRLDNVPEDEDGALWQTARCGWRDWAG